jgi:uncharacterized repeat protein (TIGR02543 family)
LAIIVAATVIVAGNFVASEVDATDAAGDSGAGVGTGDSGASAPAGDSGASVGAGDSGADYSAATNIEDGRAYGGGGEDSAPAAVPVTVCKVAFDPNGGIGHASMDIEQGAPIGELPSATNAGYTLLGWYTEMSGGQAVSEAYIVTQDITLYAHWKANRYKVSFKASGGKVNGKSSHRRVLTYGSKIGKLPTPVRKNFKFLGWYTAKIGGGKIKTGTKVPAGDVSYYAHWLRLKVNAPLLNQNPSYPTGCEAASVAMLVSHASGKKVPVSSIVKRMPYSSSDPNKGYVGNPRSYSGWTIYPPALKNVVKHYAGSAKVLTGAKLSTLKKYIKNNKPVVVWLGPLSGFNLHCCLMTGYSADGKYIYYNDPYGAQRRKITTSAFKSLWQNMGRRAISY